MIIKGKDVQEMIDRLQTNSPEIMKVKGYENDTFTYENGAIRDDNTMEIATIDSDLSYSKVTEKLAKMMIELSL